MAETFSGTNKCAVTASTACAGLQDYLVSLHSVGG